MPAQRPRRLTFGTAAELYDQIRPEYPAALVTAVLEHCGGTGARALEVGAGTGKATRAFAARGMRVTALEPDPAMAGILTTHCAGYPGVQVVASGFEGYRPAEPFGLLYSAQAWHWTDPAMRWRLAAGALAPGGSLALFWNLDHISDPRVQAGVSAAHRKVTPDIVWDSKPVPDQGLLDRWPAIEIAPLESFTALAARLFRWERVLTRQQYLDYLATHSAYLILAEQPRTTLFAAIAQALPDTVSLAEDTILYLARRTG